MTDPANYTLVGQSTGAATIQSVQYNPNTRTALLVVSGLVADSYTLTVGDSIQSANRTRPAGALRHALHDGQRPLAVRQADLHDARDRTANTGTVSFDVTIKNTSQFDLLAPLLLILDPAPGFTGTPQNAAQSSSGSWLISLNSSVPGRRRARRRARARPVRR